MQYQFREIEKKWQKWWQENKMYKVFNQSDKPKCYILDMFPYPSGAGLHVGHPLGYIASDIYARYKRLKGYNVLHPMGYDAFGLPAEQYAIEHGIHPKISTEKNILTFRRQLDNIGFSYDWDREVRTCDPAYYRWTQWIFLKLFNSFFNRNLNKAEPIEKLIQTFELEGNRNHPVPSLSFPIQHFDETDWKQFDEKTRHDILMQYRLVYSAFGEVNWCEALGTVLANDEVVNGVSERGGHPVVKKKLRQWYLRITEYADRLLDGLQHIEFSEAMKEMQTNWIGKSSGANILFDIEGTDHKLEVFTTRPDTIFGVDFMVLAPEHDLTVAITTSAQKDAVLKYIEYVKSRSEVERMAEKKITGVFTGAHCIHPFTGKKIPVWVSEYVLMGYGTGAIMAVPCGDERDHKFAKHFGIPITNIIGSAYNGEEANPTKEAILENSDFLNGMIMKEAIEIVIQKLEEKGIGKRKINYKMRDAAFSRQRYWGEPIPIVWKEGMAFPLNEEKLPLLLPDVASYRPGPEGESPLANITSWTHQFYNDPHIAGGGGVLETNTMPGFAGSSWYFLRYMDPDNEKEFCSRQASDYWNQVDVYVGGTEHAVGHLLYSRMWTKVLYDLGYIGFDEPFKKLINQGMIQGTSRFVYRVRGTQQFVSHGLLEENESSYRGKPVDKLYADVNLTDGLILNTEAFKKWKPEFAEAEFILENGKYVCGSEVEKMSKSRFNTVNPDDVIEKYGADTFRMYEMFLGPVEQSKPWDTQGIEGVHRFLKKLWRLFFDEQKGAIWNNESPTPEELKILHKTIKKAEEDTERFSFNTAVSAFMICVNELHELKCSKREILEPFLIILAPYAPHICEELWHALGNRESVLRQTYPVVNEEFLKEKVKHYPVAINGKTRTEIVLDIEASQEQAESAVLKNDIVLKWLDGKKPKKIIFVKNRMINIVV
ncbi:MAG: leucine--tRNA ligase [Chitinophagaceae bacterium]|nr:leucine--tRNA ligase [Chitinophagaceae bacterium]